MRIGLVHLSDLHIENAQIVHMEKITALVNSLQVLQPLDGIIIAFSGDIAGHGYMNEYKLAERFVSSLSSAIIRKYNIFPNNVKILIAPGNHDMNRIISPQVEREKIEEWHSNRKIDLHIRDELARMRDFYTFSDGQKCFFQEDPQPFTRKVLPFVLNSGEKYYVEANIFNSAIFSGDNDNGIHYLPSVIYRNLSMWSPARFSISIMHHSPDWFWPEQKVKLQEEIYKRSNLVLYGHEHYESTQRTVYNDEKLAFIQAGGAWWEGDFENSSYYIGIFDTKTRKYQQFCFSWNESRKFYEHKDCIEEILPDKYVGSATLTPESAYIKELLSEEKQNVCSDFSRYFVFPELQPIDSGDYETDGSINTEEELISIIEKTPQFMIVGGHNSGKTTLLKHLFLTLKDKYTVLLCGIPDVAGKKQENIIREVFSNIYGNEPDKFRLFEQQEKEKKILLIDDANEIKPEHLQKLLHGLQNSFAHIIITSKKDFTFDVREQVSSMLELDHTICQFAISQFYANKRAELVNNLVMQLNDSPRIRNDVLAYKIDKALDLQNISFKLDPAFIVQFTSYYCFHINELQNENVNVFSKVFEAAIELAIRPHLFRETVGQVKAALSEVAYYIHFHKEYPVSEVAISTVIEAYSQKYDEDLTTGRFLDIVTSARLLTKSPIDLMYTFQSKDYLAYFAASALSRHFNEDDPHAEEDLSYVLNFSCFSINSTILKYIAYSTENIKIIKLLLQQANCYVQDWGIYDIDNAQFQYLKEIAENSPDAITGNEKRKAIQVKADSEKELVEQENETISVVGLYDYDEEDVWDINNQLIRALLQMRVIASALPTFSHIMPGDIKRELIKALYEMPNKIFYQWGSTVDKTLEDLIEEFSEKQYEDTQIPITEDDVKKIKGAMQKLSTNLLLNLYYSVSREAATIATIHNISRLDDNPNVNQRLERLMFYEEVDDWATFIKEAEDLYKETRSTMVRNMIKSMVYHILVWSPTLPTSQGHHLMDKFKFKKSSKLYLPSSRK